MSATPFNNGWPIDDRPFLVSKNATSYIAAASRTGLLPYRAVIFDSTIAIGVGSAAQQPVINPTLALVNGERLIGVVVDPRNTLPNGSYTLDDFAPIPINHQCNVRLAGAVPVKTDTTTSGTPISPGDLVVASSTANFNGCGAKGSLSSNAPAAGQHIIGISFSKVTINSGFALTYLQMREV